MININQSFYTYIIIIIIMSIIMIIIDYQLLLLSLYIIIIYLSFIQQLYHWYMYANDKTAISTRTHRDHTHLPCTCQDVDLTHPFEDSGRAYQNIYIWKPSVHFSLAFRKKRFHVIVLCSHCALQAFVAGSNGQTECSAMSADIRLLRGGNKAQTEMS